MLIAVAGTWHMPYKCLLFKRMITCTQDSEFMVDGNREAATVSPEGKLQELNKNWDPEPVKAKYVNHFFLQISWEFKILQRQTIGLNEMLMGLQTDSEVFWLL